MKLLGISIVSWICGLLAYVTALKIVWGKTISPGDRNAVLGWTAIGAAIAVAVVFGPVMAGLHRWRGDRSGRAWLFPAVGTLLAPFPVGLILAVWSPNVLRAFLTPEAGLFLWMFAVFGAVFGAGFSLAYRQWPSRSRANP